MTGSKKKIIAVLLTLTMIGIFAVIKGSTVQETCEARSGSVQAAFQPVFLVDGYRFFPYPDKSNDNIPTLLLPGNARLDALTMKCPAGWTVDGYRADRYGNIKLDFSAAENQTLTLTALPGSEAAAIGGEKQTVILRALVGSDIASVYLEIDEDSENSIVDVDGDPEHESRAVGSVSLLNAHEGEKLRNCAMELKGRGNASWSRAKKGYQIKLDERKNILSMGAAKKWILLPSPVDHALIRNAIGLDLAEQLGLDFTSQWRFVDVYLDGAYNGLYILSEKVEIYPNRIAIKSIDDTLEAAIGQGNYLSDQENVVYSDDHKTARVNGVTVDLTGGYHLEFDNYKDPLQFAAGNIYHVTVNEPEYLGRDAQTDESFTYIRDYLESADKAILDTGSDDFLNYIDIESFARMWLLLEAIDAGDATDNMHIWKESELTGDGKIHAGPAWDYDRIMARDLPYGSAVIEDANQKRIDENDENLPQNLDKYADYNAYWIIRLMKHPEFLAEINRQYELHRDALFTCRKTDANGEQIETSQIQGEVCGGCYVNLFVDEQESQIQKSLMMDLSRWYGYKFNHTNEIGDGSLTSESREISMANLKQFGCVRNTYLERRIASWKDIVLREVMGENSASAVPCEIILNGRTFLPVEDESCGGVTTFLLPGCADLSDLKLRCAPEYIVKDGAYNRNGEVTLDFLKSPDNLLTLSVDPIVGAEYFGLDQKIQLRAVKSSDIPAVYLSVTDGSIEAVNEDVNHETKAKVNLSFLNDTGVGTPKSNLSGKIIGRGNASWKRAKKSYQITLDAKADILGMGMAKKWILVPSSADLSLVRTAMGFELARRLEMEFAGEWNYVDLYIDGEYYGLYILCEKVEIAPSRMDITDLDGKLQDAIGKDQVLADQVGLTYSDDYSTVTLNGGIRRIDLTGGYHLELDNYDEALQFRVPIDGSNEEQRITVKSPKSLGSTPEMDESFSYIRRFMIEMSQAIAGDDDTKLAQYIDLESFAKMWLLKQYLDDYDSVRNMHLWKESDITGDGLVHAGPAWDFDNSMCRDVYDVASAVNEAETHTYFEKDGSAKCMYFLEKHQIFRAEVVKQYRAWRSLFANCAVCNPVENLSACDNCKVCYFHNFAVEQAQKIENAAHMDTIRWYGTKFANQVLDEASRATSLQVVEAFSCARSTYLEKRISEWEQSLEQKCFEDNEK